MSGPMYNAYTVRNYKSGNEEKSYWIKIGAVFAHKNGNGMDIVLDALPIDGRIVLREPKKGEDTPPAE